MFKKGLTVLVLCMCMFIPLFSGCGKPDNSLTHSLNIDYVKDLAIDVNNATAFGIKKATVKNSVSSQANLFSNTFLNATPVAAAENVFEKNYLYSTTEVYENGNVEYNENTITKVTFKKSTIVDENVYDSQGNLIDSNRTITQEEIPAQINKLHVNSDYMFMQFVALVNKSGDYHYYEGDQLKWEYVDLRPDELVYDENGISEYDLTNYYSSALSQSFVVDLKNGFIYKISDINILKICDENVVQDVNGNFYKMTINANNELTFTDIMPNKDVSINNVVTDKYGYIFVANSNINSVDEDNKIIYFTDKLYMISDDKQVYLIDYINGTLLNEINKIVINGIEEDIDITNLTVSGLSLIKQNFISPNIIGYYKGYVVYQQNIYGDGGAILIEDSIIYQTSVRRNIHWFNQDFTTSTLILFLDNNLYYMNVNLDDYLGTKSLINFTDFTKISDKQLARVTENYYQIIGGNKILIKNVYAEKTVTSTNYYKLVNDNNEIKLELLENKEYSQNMYIFQPINK